MSKKVKGWELREGDVIEVHSNTGDLLFDGARKVYHKLKLEDLDLYYVFTNPYWPTGMWAPRNQKEIESAEIRYGPKEYPVRIRQNSTYTLVGRTERESKLLSRKGKANRFWEKLKNIFNIFGK